MQTFIASSGLRRSRFLLSLSVPVFLLLAFIAKQFSSVDFMDWHSGFSHPLTGWDHLVTMLAVGIWAAQMRGKAIWLLPLAFVSVMSLGGLVGAAGVDIPSLEGIMLLSGAVFGVLITRNIRFSSKINVLIVAFFAFFHGYSHGQEISTSASLISYTLGFMLATLLLHGAGILLAKLVILGFTALLTILFAGPLHANTFTSSLDQLNSTQLILNQEQATGFYSRLDFEQLSRRHDERSQRVTSVDTELVKTAVNKSALQSLDYGFRQQAASVRLPINNLMDNQLDNERLSDFKQKFPTINYTPGQALASNGVGLHSPPSSANLFVRNTSLNRIDLALYAAISKTTAYSVNRDYLNFVLGNKSSVASLTRLATFSNCRADAHNVNAASISARDIYDALYVFYKKNTYKTMTL